MRNIEIKAQVRNREDFLERVRSIAKQTAILQQVDYFFNVPKERGRLKLRLQNDPQNGQLVFYKRSDQSGPKLSSYVLCSTDKPDLLMSCLELAVGISGKVQKTRTLFMYGQTRIHFDEVNQLGTFMELEVVLDESQSVEKGQAIAEGIMEQLGIQQSDLLEGAYFDLLKKVEKN